MNELEVLGGVGTNENRLDHKVPCEKPLGTRSTRDGRGSLWCLRVVQ